MAIAHKLLFVAGWVDGDPGSRSRLIDFTSSKRSSSMSDHHEAADGVIGESG